MKPAAANRSRSLTYLVYVALLLFPTVVQAQPSFEEGTIITLRGDTLRGLIDTQHWIEDSDAIRFKSSRSRPVQVFPHETVASLYVSGERYERHVVHVDETPLRVRPAHYESRPSARVDTVFLAALVKGPVSLYAYHDTRPHFYIESTSGIHELIAHEWIMMVRDEAGNRRYRTITDDRYKEQIRQVQTRCPEVAIGRIAYNASRLRRFVEACNEQIDPDGVQVLKGPQMISIKHEVVAGASRATLTIDPPRRRPFTFDPSYTLSLGYHAHVRLRDQRRTPFLLGVQLRMFSMRKREVEVVNVQHCHDETAPCEGVRNYIVGGDMTIRSTELNLFLGARRLFSTKTVRPFVELGATVSTPLYFRAEEYASHVIYSLQPSSLPVSQWEEGDELFREEKTGTLWPKGAYNAGALVGLGVAYGPCSLTLRMERTLGLSGTHGLASPLRFSYLHVGYVF